MLSDNPRKRMIAAGKVDATSLLAGAGDAPFRPMRFWRLAEDTPAGDTGESL